MAAWTDSHVHIWTPDTEAYPVLPGTDFGGRRPADFGPEVLAAVARPSGVERFVLVAHQLYYGADNSYMLDELAQQPNIFRIVAFVDHRDPNVGERMAELQTEGVVGFRIAPEPDTAATWLQDDGYRAMFEAASATGQAMCPLVDPDGLGEIDRMCGEHPKVTVVIDHLARIGAEGTIANADVEALCALAKRPNVHVKLSAFNALGAKRPPHDDLIPVIESVTKAFGTQRLMWGSDAPYHLQGETYDDSLAVVRDGLDFIGDAEREDILSGTAGRVFFS